MGRRTGLCLVAILMSLRAAALGALVSHVLFYSTEAGKQNGAMLETYWQVTPGDLHYTKQDSLWRSVIKVDVVLRNETGVIAEEHQSLRTPKAAALYEAQMQNITDLHRYRLPEGKAVMELTLSEQGYPKNVFRYTDTIMVEKISGTSYSNIQLLDTVYPTTQRNIFVKNGKMNIPLCSNFLDHFHSMLHYYAELYQPDLMDTSNYPLVQRVFISKKEYEMPVNGLMRKDSIGRNGTLPQYGDFKITSLGSGNYYLNIVLEDKTGVRLAANSYFFQRENKNPEEAPVTKADTGVEKVVMIDVNKTFVMKFTMEQMMAVLKMVWPVSDALEKQTIKGFQKKPDEVYMRYFIYNFWTARNKTDPEGEWKKYADKIREVNKMFGAGATRGYETDRGITYLKYGAPDERVPVNNEAGALPYEIWEYRNLGKLNQEGVFLFYRPADMINDYRLLHTTLNGETNNQGWRSVLYVNGQSNPDSRAEQYIRNR